jgi:hypothetical protein
VTPTGTHALGGCPSWIVRRQIRVSGPDPRAGSEHVVSAMVHIESASADPGGDIVHAEVEAYS